MTDQKPDPGDLTPSTDAPPTSPQPEDPALAPEQPEDVVPPNGEDVAAEPSEEAGVDEAVDAEHEAEVVADEYEAAAGTVVETEAEAADAAAAGAAWTTTPVAPDPEATEAALAALAAKPEMTLEPPISLSGDGGEPPEEGTPVLLVGGILVGAFIVALAIVLILFRPFDSPTDVDASPSPSPVLTAMPSAGPSAIATVDTPNFQGLTLADAEAKADDYGLVVRVNQVETDQVEPDTVLGQDPPPGEAVDVGSTIELSVAAAVPTNPVPDVAGLSQDDAVKAIQDAGFKVGTITGEPSDTVKAGIVISSDPKADAEASPASKIALVVSTGPELVVVPDLVDLAEADALAALDDVGLLPGDVTEATDASVVAGHVISSDPAADAEVDPGSAVDYVLSLGPELVAVPDLVDLAEADALAALDDVGLLPGDVTEATDASVVAGHVISSDPAADAEVDPGSAVDYVLSLGPELVAVPDLVDLAEADALAALDDVGLLPGDVTEATDASVVAGHVISSDPAADAEVDPGSAVDYVLSLGPELVVVPDLVDLAEADALAALDDVGLLPGDVTEATDASVVAGHVISSDPAADAEVDPGSAVDYVLSLGPELVAVPDLSGPAADASQTLSDVGLVAGDVTSAYDDSIAAGDVVSSDPAAGTEVPLGSAVAYVTSLGVETVAVPDFSGLTLAAAQDTADTAGLILETQPVETDAAAPDTIVGQDPAADSEAAVGSTVTLQVAVPVPTVAVPDLSGPAADASQTLSDVGLVAGDVTSAYDDSIAAGDVVSSDPAAGTEVPLGSAVAYVTSLGVETVAVPDFSGLTLAAAQDTADTAGLILETQPVETDAAAPDTIVGQDPAADSEAAVGSTVTLQVAVPVPTVAVPDLSGPAADASQTLSDVGLVAGDVTSAYDDSIAAGDVVSSDPAAGTEVPLGSAVAYVTSLGVETVAVPDFSGLTLAAAQDTADTAGLILETQPVETDAAAPDTIVGQDPAADSEAAVGSTVTLQVAVPVPTVAVPDLSGPAADASQTLSDVGLVAGDVTSAYDDSIAAGDVVSSDPAAGTEVPLGSAVAYVTSLGVETVAVPDFSGLTLAAAQDTADTAGLILETQPVETDAAAPDTIVGQDPAADSEAAVGSTVTLQVAVPVPTVAVPDLSGPAADASQTLSDVGLVAGDVTSAYDDSIAAGDVVSSDPAAGTEVPLGSAVAYVTSLGVETVAVPDFSGLTLAAAQDTADTAGLILETQPVETDAAAPDTIVGQDPAADSEAAVGSTVTLQVAVPVPTVAVPDLSGPAADASQTLSDVGLVAGDVTSAYDDSIAAGDVVSSDPAAGTEVPLGSAVAYVTSLGVETVAVPDFSGLTLAAAQDTADTAGLILETQPVETDAAAPDTIVGQDPAADSEAAVGSTVTLQVAVPVPTVAVPDLSGPAADASQTLSDVGLVAGDVTSAYDDSIAAGDVVSSDPAAGTEVPLGSAVAYVTSLGVETVAVPDFSGLTLAAAQDTADTAGLILETQPVETDAAAPDTIVGQDPAADSEAAVGSTVTLQVAVPVPTVAVPDLSGPAADASQTLSDVGLVAGDVTSAYDDSIAAGDVVSSDPAAGTEVPLGSAVAYVTSLGVETVAVPDFSGLTLAAAQDTADTAGLILETQPVETDAAAPDTIVGQDPAADSEAAVGSTVTLQVAVPVPTVAVPDLSGPAADASQTLSDVGLVAGDVTSAYDDSIAAGDVVSSDPAAGTEVPLGSAVAYVTSLGVETVAVPDVRQQSEADATAAIETAGLVVGSVEQRNNASIPSGEAIRTEPEAGATVDKGSSVVLVVSKGPKQVDVPDVVSLTEGKAVAALEGAELTAVASGEEFSDSISAGSVISQDPAAETTVDANSSVAYVLSLGIEQVEVPNLAGPAADAGQKLDDARLVPGEVTNDYSDDVTSGDVISQAPKAGAMVDVGSAVDYVVSQGVKPNVDVPDVRDVPQADAVSAIETAGLTLGETVEQTNEKIAAGNAIKTDPVAGTQVPLELSVALVVSSGSNLRSIPDVSGQSAADAQAALEDQGLVVSLDERTNGKVAAGDAVKTEPAAGQTVEVGSAVTLIVSKGAKQVSVPDVVGASEADAKAAIKDAQLKPGEISRTEADAPTGTVLSQDPVADSAVDQGSTVDLTVSSGPPAVDIPDVSGQSAADAQVALEDQGLVVSLDERTNGKVAAGDAVKTEPAAGQTVEVGSAVTLIVSKGAKQVSVPDVVGASEADAKAAIKDAQLKPGEISRTEADAPTGTVLSQDPVADSAVDQGSTVDLTVSSGPPAVDIPDVSGQSAADAQVALEDQGLVVSLDERTNGKVAAGDAVKTEPAAGQTVEVGSAVTLIVSKGAKQVSVPDVVGASEADAKAAIKDAQLKPGEISRTEADAPTGTVLSQDPVADSAVDQGSTVDLTVSSGPPAVDIPDVSGQSAADAQAALEDQGLVVSLDERTNGKVAAGDAVKTEPAAGQTVEVGSAVTLIVSKGAKQVSVPDVVGASEADALDSLSTAGLKPGERAEANDVAAVGVVIGQNPPAGTELDQGSSVDYVLSLGPVIEPRGQGGSLDNAQVAGQLDAVAFAVPVIRELDLGNTPYDAASPAEQAGILRQSAESLYPSATLTQEEQALKRMGLLGNDDDLASLLDQLYGQDLPITYLQSRGRQSVLQNIDKLNLPQRAEAAREFGQAAVHLAFGADSGVVDDPTDADAVLAARALDEGDGTATMLGWSAVNVNSGNQAKVDGVVVPGDDGILGSMPQLLQREYAFPFVEGLSFVDFLRNQGGWDAVNGAWGRVPETTEQILHPKRYPDDRPTTLVMDGLGNTLGQGWSEQWQQTMGELRTAVWLGDDKAAAGWGGDRLVSLDGPDGSWAIVWQTKWDKAGDVGEFVSAADAAVADLPGAHAVLEADVSSGASNPALVLLTSDDAVLASVAEALGLGDEIAAP